MLNVNDTWLYGMFVVGPLLMLYLGLRRQPLNPGALGFCFVLTVGWLGAAALALAAAISVAFVLIILGVPALIILGIRKVAGLPSWHG